MEHYKPTEKETRLASSQTHLYLEWVTSGLTRTRMNYFSETIESKNAVELARAKRTLKNQITYEIKRLVDVLVHETILDRYDKELEHLLAIRSKLKKLKF
jgi:hypothetical protein